MAKAKILMIGEYEKAMYHPMTSIDNLFVTKFPNYSFEFTSDPNAFLNASDFDLIISYWDDWNTAISDKAANALEAYVAKGGKLLVLHNGISLQLRENLKDMIGAKFLTHPTAESITFIPSHDPCTKEVSSFEIVEEPYQFEMVPDNKEIFLTYKYRNNEYPAGWKKDYQKGQVVYLCPGHTILTFEIDAYGKLIENCILKLIEQK